MRYIQYFIYEACMLMIVRRTNIEANKQIIIYLYDANYTYVDLIHNNDIHKYE